MKELIRKIKENPKDYITSIAGSVVCIAGSIDQFIAYNQTGKIDWVKSATLTAIYIISYYTGKKPNGKSVN